MTQEEEIAQLQAENQALREALLQTQELLRVALARIEELEQLKTPPPAFVKANVKPQSEKKARKKRAKEANRARRREVPTHIVEHRIDRCPVCSLGLGGVSEARRRQVIELPPPSPVEVTEHVIAHGWCDHCQAWREAPLDLSGQVVGQGRMGVRIASLIASLRTMLRLPIRAIQLYLLSLHGLKISTGEIVELLHRIKARMQPQIDALKTAIRASPAVQADETGWREEGINGYIWSVSTPTLRYYQYHHSRGSQVVKELLGEEFLGVLGSDFLASYNIHQGLHQRCWVHLLRDIHELKKLHPDDGELLAWADAIKEIYQRALASPAPDAALAPAKVAAQRVAHQHVFEEELMALCAPYLRTPAVMHTLCERIERFLPELFVFVAIEGVPSHNNLAERSVRPLVIARKISGGSRSPKGSATRMGLTSLFGTWAAAGLNPFFQCLAVLSANPLGQV